MPPEVWKKERTVLLRVEQDLAQAFIESRSDAATAVKAAEFRSRFLRLAQPGLLPHYRAMAPDFWKWLDGLGTSKAP
jgi:hypothetical protein